MKKANFLQTYPKIILPSIKFVWTSFIHKYSGFVPHLFSKLKTPKPSPRRETAKNIQYLIFNLAVPYHYFYELNQLSSQAQVQLILQSLQKNQEISAYEFEFSQKKLQSFCIFYQSSHHLIKMQQTEWYLEYDIEFMQSVLNLAMSSKEPLVSLCFCNFIELKGTI